MSAQPISIRELNALPQEAFVNLLGGIYEHSPWIASATWSRRPFATVEHLRSALDTTLRSAAPEKRVALIESHPDLAGRLARMGQLTYESTQEQKSAGLDCLSVEEAGKFERLNGEYRSRFGFPFVICARLNDRQTILEAFERRLTNSRDQEIEAALAEIHQIAGLRLAQIVQD